jgi:hypothetical protein
MSFQPSNAFEEQFRQFLQEPETQDAIRGDQEKEIKVMKKSKLPAPPLKPSSRRRGVPFSLTHTLQRAPRRENASLSPHATPAVSAALSDSHACSCLRLLSPRSG